MGAAGQCREGTLAAAQEEGSRERADPLYFLHPFVTAPTLAT